MAKEILNNTEELDLKEFMLLNSKKQDDLILDTLNKLYEDTVDVNRKHIDKVLNVAFDSKNTEAYLPKRLVVSKINDKLLFAFKKDRNFGLLIIFLLAFLCIGGFATYTGVQYLAKAQMNQDLDGDGIADLNIDLDDDGVCDINCDTNKDGRPDRNIDYHGNRKAIFNVVLKNGGIFNETNRDTNGDGKCDINCDTNSDGWPDLNIDYDGDGKVDLDRDINNDGIKDLDLDINGDGVCDLNCDKDKDNKCDKNCTSIDIADNGGGTSSTVGPDGIEIEAAKLLVTFENETDVVVENLYPDDQPDEGVNTKVPDMKFTVENTTDQVIYYEIKWYDLYTTFESDNFWFKITSNNNGYKQGWTSTPKYPNTIASKVAIAPKTKQSYTVSFTLHGTGEKQDYDQGKKFKGSFEINIVD